MPTPVIAWKPFTSRRDVASARVRCLVPNQLLGETGWRSTLFEEADSRPDVAVFQKAYEPEDLALASQLSGQGVRIVFDLCDNHFYNPEESAELAERAGRLRRMIDLADAVTVSSPLLAEPVGKDAVFQVDDAIDPIVTARRDWRLVPRLGRLNGLRLLWFGNAGSTSPRFGIVDLAEILPDLERLHRRLPLSLTVVTNSKEAYQRLVAHRGVPTRYVRWRYSTFPTVLRQADICLLPVTINPFTVCKTSNRAVTSLLLGTPIIASGLPSYEELAPYVLFGDTNIERYGKDCDLRAGHVQAGQNYIRTRFAPEVIVQQWIRVFEAVLQ
jgi:hypothetical protein